MNRCSRIRQVLRSRWALLVTLFMIGSIGFMCPGPPSATARAVDEEAVSTTTVTLPAVADATARSDQPNTNFGSQNYLEITYTSTEVIGSERIAAVLIRFDVSSIPDDAIVDTAYLRLFLDGASGASPVPIAAYFLTSSWSESTITWSSNPTISGPGLNADIDASSGSYKSWYIPWFVQSWVDDPASNRGVLLMGPTSGPYYQRWFESRDHNEMVPQLEITYHRSPYTFAGHVFEGDPQDTTTPLDGVTVELWGDEDEWPEAGFDRVRLDSTTTSASGAFSLQWQPQAEWPYLHVIEVDPPDSYSTGAGVDAPGYVKNSNVVSYRYVELLETGLHDFSGIAFWDRFPEELPDLVVSDVWSQGAAICARVRNDGGAVAPSGHCTALSIDGTQRATLPVGVDLAPAAQWDGCFDYAWACTAETDTVTVSTDHTDVVAESVETNNSRQETWQCDTTPPRLLSGPTVSGLTATSAVISWQTDEAADSAVLYDTIASLYRSEEANPTLTTYHQITLAGLAPSTTYHFVVRSADAAGNRVKSADRIFETLAAPDALNPTVHILDSGVVSETVTIRADAGDNMGVEKVEFYLDDELAFTDFSPPYEWVFDSDEEENGNYTLKAKGFDLSGRTIVDQTTIRVANFIDINAPQVNIFYPDEGSNVYGQTPVWVTVSDDSGWSEVEWYVDGNKMGGGQFPVSPSLDIKFWWDTRFFAQGQHTLGIQAKDGENKTGVDAIVVNVANASPPLRPKLVVTKHELFRHANTFAIELTVQNQGQATAKSIEIANALSAFQPISRTFNVVSYESDLDSTTLQAEALIKDPTSLGVGASRKYIIAAVPILVHDNPPAPSIGSTIAFSYADSYGHDFQETTKFEVLKTTATPGSAPSEPIGTAHANALKEADYLIVTSPALLSFHNPFQNIDQVFSDMASLAFDEKGVLGYLRASKRNELRNLVRANGDWGKRLHSDFRTATKGYLLIVGENEIVPAWQANLWSLTWSNSACTTASVHLSDLPYADIGGSNAAPELVVGRIIGNNAADLSAAIQTALHGTFDRSHALLVSGLDGTASIQNEFTASINEIDKAINKEFNVTKLHWSSLAAAQRVPQFRSNTSGKDVIVYNGHGSPDSWGPLNTDDLPGDPTTTPPTPPVSFGSTNPVVLGLACLTGSYEDHTANAPCTHDGGDDNLAEAFFDRGAAVYIGATEVSSVIENRAAGKDFFEKWWKPNTNVGKAFTDLKRDRWSSNDYAQLWVYEYNLYGDPKYGAAPAGNSETGVPAHFGELTSGPLASIDVIVPDYDVTSSGQFDEVEIPGGDLLLDAGKYRIPYYRVMLTYPAGYQIQDVILTDRSGMVTDTGLNLPLNENLIASASALSAATATAAGSWIPDDQYHWEIIEDPDGTITLAIAMYPFYYDPLSSDVHFYKNYTFDVDYTISPLSLADIETDKGQYAQGETVHAEIWLQNGGAAQDVSVTASVKKYPTGETASGLLLQTLHGLLGSASFTSQWDTSGFEPGDYYLEVTLRDAGNQILDRGTHLFRIGVASGQVTTFTVTPLYFEVGETINAALVFENTGTLYLNGSAYIKVQDESGSLVKEFNQPFSELAPGHSITLDATWDTTGTAEGSYAIVGYVSYQGQATEADAVIVSTNKPQRHIYLPLIAQG